MGICKAKVKETFYQTASLSICLPVPSNRFQDSQNAMRTNSVATRKAKDHMRARNVINMKGMQRPNA